MPALKLETILMSVPRVSAYVASHPTGGFLVSKLIFKPIDQINTQKARFESCPSLRIE